MNLRDNASFGEEAVDRKQHWNSVYRSKEDCELSWFEREPTTSLQWIIDFCARARAGH